MTIRKDVIKLIYLPDNCQLSAFSFEKQGQNTNSKRFYKNCQSLVCLAFKFLSLAVPFFYVFSQTSSWALGYCDVVLYTIICLLKSITIWLNQKKKKTTHTHNLE